MADATNTELNLPSFIKNQKIPPDRNALSNSGEYSSIRLFQMNLSFVNSKNFPAHGSYFYRNNSLFYSFIQNNHLVFPFFFSSDPFLCYPELFEFLRKSHFLVHLLQKRKFNWVMKGYIHMNTHYFSVGVHTLV